MSDSVIKNPGLRRSLTPFELHLDVTRPTSGSVGL